MQINRLLLTCVACGVAMASYAQISRADLRSFNEDTNKRLGVQSQILGYWAIGNIGAGIVLRANSEGERRHFHTMNIGWNMVNLALATAGYIGMQKDKPGSYDLDETYRRHYNLQKVLLLNAGLDIGYMAGGLYLRERAYRSDNPEQMRGFGNSIILQGGFLFAYDVAMAYWHSRANNKLKRIVKPVELSFYGNGLGLTYSW